jgi:uncharacterized coiled-coil protein SlyX
LRSFYQSARNRSGRATGRHAYHEAGLIGPLLQALDEMRARLDEQRRLIAEQSQQIEAQTRMIDQLRQRLDEAVAGTLRLAPTSATPSPQPQTHVDNSLRALSVSSAYVAYERSWQPNTGRNERPRTSRGRRSCGRTSCSSCSLARA